MSIAERSFATPTATAHPLAPQLRGARGTAPSKTGFAPPPMIQVAVYELRSPGARVHLRVLASDRSGGGGSQCCWTNAFLRVTVS